VPYDANAEAYSPSWWLKRLDKALCAKQETIRLHNGYYDGEHRLLFSTDRFRREFGTMLQRLNDNWCELVVDAVEERLNIQGFRFGKDQPANDDAWTIWQRNNMDAQSQMAHVEALVCAETAVLAWYDPGSSFACISAERADQVIVECTPGSTQERAAGLKRWVDEGEKKVYATLYLPEALYKWEAPYRRIDGTYDPSRVRWVDREGEDHESPNPLGVVPLVPLKNRPRLGRPSRSEIASVIPLQDATNTLLANMLVAGEFAAFRQRWATGLEIPEDPETNQPIEPFKAAVDRLWVSGSKDTTFGEFEQTDLGPYVQSIEMVVQHIASQTRTPPHYFYLSGQFPSGESIKSAETGLVAKTRRKMVFFGEAWEEVMRLALRIEGKDEAADEVASEVIWADPESRSESEHIDALVKQTTIGVPNEALWRRAGYTPTEIEEFKAMREREPEVPVLVLQPTARGLAGQGNGANPSNGAQGANSV